MPIATMIDVDALWHVALYSFLAGIGLVTAYATGVLALDRIGRSEAAPGARAGWTLIVSVAALVCLGLLAVGFWAMTQK